MFFKYKDKPPYNYGDHRVVRSFALFPRVVVNRGYESIGVVWLERYDIVQMFYATRWAWGSNHKFGDGTAVAVYRADMYNAQVIERDKP